MTSEIETETIETELPAPREKPIGRKKPVRRYKRRLTPRIAKVSSFASAGFIRTVETSDEFAGMTKALCPAACGPAGCCITGGSCAHPMKTGLQAAYAGNQETTARYARAKKALDHQKIDAR